MYVLNFNTKPSYLCAPTPQTTGRHVFIDALDTVLVRTKTINLCTNFSMGDINYVNIRMDQGFLNCLSPKPFCSNIVDYSSWHQAFKKSMNLIILSYIIIRCKGSLSIDTFHFTPWQYYQNLHCQECITGKQC